MVLKTYTELLLKIIKEYLSIWNNITIFFHFNNKSPCILVRVKVYMYSYHVRMLMCLQSFQIVEPIIYTRRTTSYGKRLQCYLFSLMFCMFPHKKNEKIIPSPLPSIAEP